MKKLAMIAMGLMAVYGAQSVQAQQVLAAWNSVTNATVESTLAVASNATDVTAGTFSATGVSAQNTPACWSWGNWPTNNAPDTGKYWTFTLTPAADKKMSITTLGLNLDYVANANGPTSWVVRTSVDGYAANAGAFQSVASVTETVYPVTISGISGQSAAVTVRIYGFNNTVTDPTKRAGIGFAGPAKGDVYVEGAIEGTAFPGSVVIIK